MSGVYKRVVLGGNETVNEFAESESTANELMKQLLYSAQYNGNITSKYKLIDDSYSADGGFSNGSYLIPHPRERQDKYNRRKNMAYYINYVKPIVDAHINPIFSHEPTRDGLTDTYRVFLNDVDGNGTKITRFMKKAAIRAKLHGCEFICIDMESIDESDIITKDDVVKNRIYPYLYLISPEQVTNWATDKFGRLIYFSYQVNSHTVDDEGNVQTVVETYKWTKDYCIKKIGDADEERTINQLGVIPIIPVYGTLNTGDDLIPNSDLYAISQAELALYNVCSELRERNRNQAFSILSYPIADDDDYENAIDGITLGTADMLLYKDGSQKPGYITPPTDSTDMLLSEIDMIKREIFRMSAMSFVTQEQVSNVSGLAKAYDNQQLYQSILDLSQSCQMAEYKIAKMFCRYMGETMDNISIMYNHEFGVVDPTEVLTNATQALALNICEGFNEEVKKQVIRAILTDVDNSVIDSVLKDFESTEDRGSAINENQEVKVVQPTG